MNFFSPPIQNHLQRGGVVNRCSGAFRCKLDEENSKLVHPTDKGAYDLNHSSTFDSIFFCNDWAIESKNTDYAEVIDKLKEYLFPYVVDVKINRDVLLPTYEEYHDEIFIFINTTIENVDFCEEMLHQFDVEFLREWNKYRNVNAIIMPVYI